MIGLSLSFKKIGDRMPKPKPGPLWQEITAVLLIKGIALTLIWFLWFSTPVHNAQDGKKLVDTLFSSQRQIDKEIDHGPVN